LRSQVKRCPWSGSDPEMIHYHDTEWGFVQHNDQQHFEFLILEAAQAGLSWSTVLKRRDGYRKAFANFDPVKVSRFDQNKLETLLGNPQIIRNRLKIESVIHNAPLFIKVQKEFGSFDTYMWSFTNHKQICHRRKTSRSVPATSPESDRISKDLKLRGFKFVGSTVIYAHLQAVGIVNDHLTSCFRYKTCLKG
jgi:DNA-3-methyladenine glycosylase I